MGKVFLKQYVEEEPIAEHLQHSDFKCPKDTYLFMFKYPKAEQNKIKAIIMSNYYKESKNKDSKTS